MTDWSELGKKELLPGLGGLRHFAAQSRAGTLESASCPLIHKLRARWVWFTTVEAFRDTRRLRPQLGSDLVRAFGLVAIVEDAMFHLSPRGVNPFSEREN